MWTSRDNRDSNAAALRSTCAPRVAWAGLDLRLHPTPPRTEVLEAEGVGETEERGVVEERGTTWSYLAGQSLSNLQHPPPKEEAWDWGVRTSLSTLQWRILPSRHLPLLWPFTRQRVRPIRQILCHPVWVTWTSPWTSTAPLGRSKHCPMGRATWCLRVVLCTPMEDICIPMGILCS